MLKRAQTQVAPWQLRLLRVAFFTVLIAISAKITIPLPGTPVPFTAQTLMILVTGMLLGPVEGALSVMVYLGGIAAGMPIDAFSRGSAALVGPTAGYLLGFVPAVIVAGLGWRAPLKWRVFVNLAAGLVAAAIILGVGMVGLYLLRGSWLVAFSSGVLPFVLVDFGKALLAASLVNLGDQSWLRWLSLRRDTNR